MDAVRFTAQDSDNLELVRQVVFQRLKNDAQFNQFYAQWLGSAEKFVLFEEPVQRTRARFELLADEILWQLFIQGVITPGINESNPDFPWFRLTAYGEKVLQEERFIPHDPSGYLSEISTLAESVVGDSAIKYLEESLRCYTSGCHISSVLLLGIAAEAVLLNLCEALQKTIEDPKDRENFEKLKFIKQKHSWLVRKFEQLPIQKKRQLPESLDLTLSSLYDLIRKQRNDLGHPQERPPNVDRDVAFMYMKLFPTFVKDIEAFAKFCDRSKSAS